MPTLLMTGEEDEVIPTGALRALHKQIPGSKLVSVPEAGHSIYFQHPDLFNSELSAFLDENYPGTY